MIKRYRRYRVLGWAVKRRCRVERWFVFCFGRGKVVNKSVLRPESVIGAGWVCLSLFIGSLSNCDCCDIIVVARGLGSMVWTLWTLLLSICVFYFWNK